MTKQTTILIIAVLAIAIIVGLFFITKPTPSEACPEIYKPVCGKNGQTYSNDCVAKQKGIDVDYRGECRKEPIKRICGDGVCDEIEKRRNLCPEDCEELPPSEEQTCLEQEGNICSSDEVCPGFWLDASDSERCCETVCKKISQDSTVNVEVDFSKEVGRVNPLVFGVTSKLIDKEAAGLLTEAGFTITSVRREGVFPQSGNPNADPNDISEYDFEDLDRGVQLALDAGLEPVICFWFTLTEVPPDGKRIGPTTSHENYAKVIKNIVRHLTQGWADGHHWPIKYFRFWNEPETELGWGGEPEEFYEFYATWARAVKSVDSEFVVGGINPANPPEHSFILGLLEYCKENNVPLDYFSWQFYGEVPYAAYKEAKLFQEFLSQYPVSPIYGTPLSASLEWNLMIGAPWTGFYHEQFDTAWVASHNVATLIHLIKGGVSISTKYGGLSRASMDPDVADLEDFILVYPYPDGRPKPVYYGLKGINMMKETPILIDSTGTDEFGFATIAGKSEDGKTLTIVISNFNPRLYLEEYPLSDEIKNIPDDLPEDERERRIENLKRKEKELSDKLKDVVDYTNYDLSITNLPWGDNPYKYERYLVDETHKLELIESKQMKGDFSISRETTSPEVQVIRLSLEEK